MLLIDRTVTAFANLLVGAIMVTYLVGGPGVDPIIKSRKRKVQTRPSFAASGEAQEWSGRLEHPCERLLEQ